MLLFPVSLSLSAARGGGGRDRVRVRPKRRLAQACQLLDKCILVHHDILILLCLAVKHLPFSESRAGRCETMRFFFPMPHCLHRETTDCCTYGSLILRNTSKAFILQVYLGILSASLAGVAKCLCTAAATELLLSHQMRQQCSSTAQHPRWEERQGKRILSHG